MIGDALGLSIVHVNRVLRQLRDAKLATLRRGMAWVLDPAALAALAVLEPSDAAATVARTPVDSPLARNLRL
jgi:hypothetical protein